MGSRDSDGPVLGGAYAIASEGLVRMLSDAPQLMAEVVGVYQDSLRWVWWIAVPFGGIGLLLCVPVEQLVLSKKLHTEFGQAGGDYKWRRTMNSQSGRR